MTMKNPNPLFVAAFAAAILLGIAAGVFAPATAVAADGQKLSASLMKPLKAVDEAMAAKNWDQALIHVKEAQAVQPQTPYDSFIVNERAWYVLYQTKDTAGAAAALETVVNSGFVAAADLPQRLKIVAQLYYQLQNYPKAIEYGNRYLEAVPGDRDAGVLVAQSYYLQKDYANARAAVQKLNSGAAKPSEPLLLIALSCNVALQDGPGQVQALDALIRNYPKSKYWEDRLNVQLYQTKGDRELRNLYRLIEQTNTLDKPEEYSEMAGVLISGGFPSEAAKILELGMTANVFTGPTLTREKSDLDRARTSAAADRKDLAGADKALAAAKSGNEMVAFGKLYFSVADYAKAVDAIRKGLAKGGVTDMDDANALLGVALVRAGQPADARPAFDAVKDPKYAAVTQLWVLYMDSQAAAAEPAAAAGS
jgi:tetratricopeptide (TPR) repeat protein